MHNNIMHEREYLYMHFFCQTNWLGSMVYFTALSWSRLAYRSPDKWKDNTCMKYMNRAMAGWLGPQSLDDGLQLLLVIELILLTNLYWGHLWREEREGEGGRRQGRWWEERVREEGWREIRLHFRAHSKSIVLSRLYIPLCWLMSVSLPWLVSGWLVASPLPPL